MKKFESTGSTIQISFRFQEDRQLRKDFNVGTQTLNSKFAGLHGVNQSESTLRNVKFGWKELNGLTNNCSLIFFFFYTYATSFK